MSTSILEDIPFRAQCCWTELNKDGLNIQCESKETSIDIDNEFERFFCFFHLQKVIETRFKMYLKMKRKYEGI